jgi:hypothetical protein
VTKTKSAYAVLPEKVREIIDRSAPAVAKKHGMTLRQAREALAARVVKKETRRYTHGTGH